MKVILTQDVRGQGKRGQMIEVSDGYARNFLLPRKLAQEATADNINTMRMAQGATTTAGTTAATKKGMTQNGKMQQRHSATCRRERRFSLAGSRAGRV